VETCFLYWGSLAEEAPSIEMLAAITLANGWPGWAAAKTDRKAFSSYGANGNTGGGREKG
jgi:hypothetical protein